jgi:hypothetical protein
LPAVAHGQVIVEQPRDDVPALVALSPVAVRAGETTELAIGGERLAGLQAVLCQGIELVEVTSLEEKSARLRVRTVPGAAPGVYPLHVLCEAGLSNPRMIVIDTAPQLVESEPNDVPQQATEITAPCGVSGVLKADDRDCFRFQVRAGDTLLFDLRASRIGSPLAGVLTLHDAQGLELRKAIVAPHAIAPDMRLAHTFAREGAYCVCVSDLTYQGADFAPYHLHIGPADETAPLYAEAMYPLGGRAGQQTQVELSGGNLRQSVVHKVDLGADLDWSRKRLEIPGEGGMIVAPALFAAGRHPERLEQEPNDNAEHAESIEWPLTLNGRFEKPGDRDCYRFRAATGDKLLIEMFAERLGTAIDGVLLVKDAAGRTIAEADDTTIAERLPPVIRSADDAGITDDPRLEVTAPADGEYVIEVSDRYGHGGPALAYRVEVCQEQQDFELLVQPGRVEPANPNDRRRNRARQIMPQFDGRGGGALSIDRGGRGSLVVRAIRRGFQGPITLSAAGLPAGLHMQPASIVAGQNQAIVDFYTDFDAQCSAGFVSIVGSAQDEAGRLTRRAIQPVLFAGLPLGAVAQRELEVVAIGISNRGAELAVRGTLAGPVTPGGTSILRVELRRREGFQGPVELLAINLPTGLAIAPLTVPESQNEVELPLVAAADVTPGTRSLQLEGRLTVKDRKEPLVAIAPVEIDVRPLVVVELLTQTLELAPGGTAPLEFRIQQNGASPVPIALELSRLPDGVSSAEASIPAEAQSFALALSAAGDVRPSPIPRVVQVKPVAQAAGNPLELPTQRVILKIVKPK